jgi:hypothetical protein
MHSLAGLVRLAIVAQLFKTSGLLQAIEQRVRFARRRFGTYEVLDFVVVLIGYASRVQNRPLRRFTNALSLLLPQITGALRSKEPVVLQKEN